MTEHETDGFTIPRHEQTELRELLAQVTALVEDLAVTLTRQDRITTTSGKRGRLDASPLPLNLAASDATDHLADTLRAWIDHTVTHRKLDHPGNLYPVAAAAWLRRWTIALALTPDAKHALPQIHAAITRARRTCDRPTEPPRPTPDPGRLHRARSLELNARAIAALARELGHPHITQRRIKHEQWSGRLHPLRKDRITGHIYRLGAVLDHFDPDGRTDLTSDGRAP